MIDYQVSARNGPEQTGTPFRFGRCIFVNVPSTTKFSYRSGSSSVESDIRSGSENFLF